MLVFIRFSSLGMSPLVRLHNRVNAAMNKNLLEEQVVVQILQNPGFKNPVFMQDNGPCHKAKWVIADLNNQGINIMD